MTCSGLSLSSFLLPCHNLGLLGASDLLLLVLALFSQFLLVLTFSPIPICKGKST